MVKILTDENFEEEVLDAEGVVLVDFWAPWCGPCQIMGPMIEELGEEYGDDVKGGKLNVDENSEATEAYGVMNLPTLMFFEDGEQIDQLVGAHPRETVVKFIDDLLG